MGPNIGRAYFEGPQPTNCRSIGDVRIYYNGAFPSNCLNYGGVQHYDFDGDVWVVYSPSYRGEPRIEAHSRYGRVQVGHA